VPTGPAFTRLPRFRLYVAVGAPYQNPRLHAVMSGSVVGFFTSLLGQY